MFRVPLCKSAITAGVVLALAGCGAGSSAGSSAATGAQAYKLLTTAKSAAQSAKSLRLVAAFTNAGQRDTIDVSFSGSDLAGTITNGAGPLGIVDVHGTVYVKVSAAFLKAQHAPASLCKLMCGKYFKATAAQSATFINMVRLPSLLSMMFSGLPKSAAAFHGLAFKSSTVDGQAAQCAKGGKFSICLAGHGTPYLLEVSSQDGKQAFHFSQWNKVPAIQAPPKSQTVDLSQLGG